MQNPSALRKKTFLDIFYAKPFSAALKTFLDIFYVKPFSAARKKFKRFLMVFDEFLSFSRIPLNFAPEPKLFEEGYKTS